MAGCGQPRFVPEQRAVRAASITRSLAQRRAKDEARKELQKARLEKSKEDAHAKVEELKSKLHRPKTGASA